MSWLFRWITRAILLGIGTIMWRYQVRQLDRIDVQLHELDLGLGDLTREVVTNGKNIARIGSRYEGPPDPVTAHPTEFEGPLAQEP